MDFLDKRVGVICNELKKLKVKQIFPLTQWEYKEGNFVHPEDALNDAAAWENFDCKTMLTQLFCLVQDTITGTLRNNIFNPINQ